jgi:hypothetical protein
LFELLPNTLALRSGFAKNRLVATKSRPASSQAVHLIESRIDKARTTPAMDFAQHLWLSCNK